MDRLLKEFGTVSLWKVSFEGLIDFARFVVSTNYETHQHVSEVSQDEVNKVLEQEKILYKHSRLFAIKDEQRKYLGSIRVTLWDGIVDLPITNQFGVDVQKVFKSRHIKPEEVWHVGRLAVNQKILKDKGYSLTHRSMILKILIAQALIPICKKSTNVLLAECDERFLANASNLKLKNFDLVGKPIVYLGSAAIPVMNTVPNLLPFLEINKSLCYVPEELPVC